MYSQMVHNIHYEKGLTPNNRENVHQLEHGAHTAQPTRPRTHTRTHVMNEEGQRTRRTGLDHRAYTIWITGSFPS